MTSIRILPGRLLILLITLVAVLLLLGGVGEASTPTITIEHRVSAGDTLWNIAEGFTTPGDDVRDSVAMLRDLNELTSSALMPGQVLLVPAG
jgi:LysM repeat protein